MTNRYLIAAIGFFLSASVTVQAHAPALTITSIDGQDASLPVSLSIPSTDFPKTVNVGVLVEHSGQGNANAVADLTLSVNGVQEGSVVDVDCGGPNPASCPVLMPWSINGAGSYTLLVTAKHGANNGSDTAEAIVTEISVVVNSCPAAPAVAAHYLKEQGEKSGSKMFKNVISLVAQHMGPQSNFNGLTACGAGYEVAVKAFVDANKNIAK